MSQQSWPPANLSHNAKDNKTLQRHICLFRESSRTMTSQGRSENSDQSGPLHPMLPNADPLEFALEKLGKAELSLKEAQYEALKSVVFEGKDTICILPAGYGKSLIYQLLPHVFDYFLSSEEDSSLIILVLPLNALVQDQINKLRGHLNVWILKDHRNYF